MVLLLRKLFLYFTKDPEAVHYFRGVGSLFSRGGGGVQMLTSIETHICTCYFPGGVSALDPRMGNVIITGQYLSQSGF